MELVTRWHRIRSDFEQKLFAITNDDLLLKGSAGDHKVDIFHGHCQGEGGENYLSINAEQESFRLVPNLYQ